MSTPNPVDYPIREIATAHSSQTEPVSSPIVYPLHEDDDGAHRTRTESCQITRIVRPVTVHII